MSEVAGSGDRRGPSRIPGISGFSASGEPTRRELRINHYHEPRCFPCRHTCERLAAGFASGLVQPDWAVWSACGRTGAGGLLPPGEQQARSGDAQAQTPVAKCCSSRASLRKRSPGSRPIRPLGRCPLPRPILTAAPASRHSPHRPSHHSFRRSSATRPAVRLAVLNLGTLPAFLRVSTVALCRPF